jgi:hypothetical protein
VSIPGRPDSAVRGAERPVCSLTLRVGLVSWLLSCSTQVSPEAETAVTEEDLNKARCQTSNFLLRKSGAERAKA